MAKIYQFPNQEVESEKRKIAAEETRRAIRRLYKKAKGAFRRIDEWPTRWEEKQP